MSFFSKQVRDVDGRTLKKHDEVEHLRAARTGQRVIKAGDVERVTEVDGAGGTVCTVGKFGQWDVCVLGDQVRKVRS